MREVSKAFMEPVVGKQAACATVEPELFFPLYTIGGDGELHEAQAKAVCQRCPLMYACLEFALHTEDDWAILGGMTPAERRLLRKNNRTALPNPFIPLEEAA